MPARVWLFAWPLVLCLGAAGIAAALCTLARRVGWTAHVADRTAMAVAALPLCVYAWQTRPPVYAEVFSDPAEAAMTRDVEEVTMYLKGELHASDAVVAVFPTVDLLEYYFRVHDVPVAPLRIRSPQAGRLLLVANETIGLTVDAVLAKAGIPRDHILSATPLARFDYDVVYDVRVEPLRRRPLEP
jgi:hypothetical protein